MYGNEAEGLANDGWKGGVEGAGVIVFVRISCVVLQYVCGV